MKNATLTTAFLAGLVTFAWADAPPFIEIDPQQSTAFREHGTGRPFVAVGVNYFSPDVGWAPKLWKQFDEAVVRRQLRMLHEQGFNTIRVFLTYESFHREPGELNTEGLAKFRTLLAICRELGLYVIPSGPDHWEGTPKWRVEKDMFADEELLEADARWWQHFAAACKDEPLLLAYDLYNEPTVKWDTPAMRRLWSDWLDRQFESVEELAAAWSLTTTRPASFEAVAPPEPKPARDDPRLHAYQRFRESVGHAWTKRMTEAIRAADPRHLVTTGHIQWASPVMLPSVWHYAGFEPRANASLHDFVTIHFYPLAEPMPSAGPTGIEANRLYLEAVLADFSVGKPLMIGEFAWYGAGEGAVWDKFPMPPQSLNDQAAWCQTLLDVSKGRLCGWLNWAFADTPTSTDLSRWSGLWTSDLKLKPWGEIYAQFAQRMSRQPSPPRPWPADLAIPPQQRSAMLTDPSLGNAWRSQLLTARRAASRPE